MQRKDKEIKGSSNGIIDGYHKWLNARTQGLDWLLKLKVLREEEAETPEESEEVQALKAELERAQAVKEKFKTMTIGRIEAIGDSGMEMGEHIYGFCI